MILMNNQTFETLQKTKVRFEAILEVDDSLNKNLKAEIRDIVELITRILDEVTASQNPV